MKIKILDLPTICDAYRPGCFHVDMNNRITMCFNYHDIQCQEDFIKENFERRGLDYERFFDKKKGN